MSDAVVGWVRIHECDCKGQVNILLSPMAETSLKADTELHKKRRCKECGSLITARIIAPLTDMHKSDIDEADRLLSIDYTKPS